MLMDLPRAQTRRVRSEQPPVGDAPAASEQEASNERRTTADMRRRPALVAGLIVLAAHTAAHAEKLPTDEGLRVTLTPSITKMRVGQVAELTLGFRDDDASSSQSTLVVPGHVTPGMHSDGRCVTPLDRSPKTGGVAARVTFKKPCKYLLRGIVETVACHGQVTGMGQERVVVTRTITVSP